MFPIRNNSKRGDYFNFALEYAVRRVR